MQINCMQFNQDHTCIVHGTNTGFTVVDARSGQILIQRQLGGIGIATMLFRSNLLAVVGSPNNKQYPPYKVMLYDDNTTRMIGDMTFRCNVSNVLLRRDRIIVVAPYKLFVYDLKTFKLVDTIVTWKNPTGLADVCHERNILTTLGLTQGSIRVDRYDESKFTLICAHKSEIAAIKLNQDGSLVATCSQQGTLIRVFDTYTGANKYEFRRGAQAARIYNLDFHPANTWILASSDHGTIHLFKLQPRRPRLFDNLVPAYFSAEFSQVQFKLKLKTGTVFIAGFLPENVEVVAMTSSGKWTKFTVT